MYRVLPQKRAIEEIASLPRLPRVYSGEIRNDDLAGPRGLPSAGRHGQAACGAKLDRPAGDCLRCGLQTEVERGDPMNTTRMPAFTAEAALFRSGRWYRSSAPFHAMELPTTVQMSRIGLPGQGCYDACWHVCMSMGQGGFSRCTEICQGTCGGLSFSTSL